MMFVAPQHLQLSGSIPLVLPVMVVLSYIGFLQICVCHEQHHWSVCHLYNIFPRRLVEPRGQRSIAQLDIQGVTSC